MRRHWSQALMPFFLLLLAALVWWTWPKQAMELPGIDWHGQIHHGDQSVTQVILRQYDAAGHLELLASAASAYHEPKQDETFLSDVHIRRFRAGGDLLLSGRHALVHDRDRDVTLWGDVRGLLQPDSTLRTQKLRYDPSSGIIRSRDPVFLTHGRSTLQGVGLWASVKTQEIRLLHDVEGSYVP